MPELAKAYEPQQVEDRLYTKWQDGAWFRANPKSAKKPYSIVMPPPNVTGKLHLGHVLNNTIQDILCRKARMEGKEVLWLPGTDHAGLSTQTMVERHLRNVEKKTRHDFTREEFIARVWQWKEEFGGIITRQLRKIGVSCDWSRESASYPRPRLRARGAGSFRAALQRGFHLSRHANGELGPGVAHRAFRRGSDPDPAEGLALLCEVPAFVGGH